MFYARLRKFKQSQKNFKIFMRGYENLNKVRKILKSLCEVTKNLKSDARTQTIKKCFIQNA